MPETLFRGFVLFKFLVHVDHHSHDVDFWKIEERVVDEETLAVLLKPVKFTRAILSYFINEFIRIAVSKLLVSQRRKAVPCNEDVSESVNFQQISHFAIKKKTSDDK